MAILHVEVSGRTLRFNLLAVSARREQPRPAAHGSTPTRNVAVQMSASESHVVAGQIHLLHDLPLRAALSDFPGHCMSASPQADSVSPECE